MVQITFNSNWGAYVISKLEGFVGIYIEEDGGIFLYVRSEKAERMIRELINERSMTAAVVDDHTWYIPRWWASAHNLKFERI